MKYQYEGSILVIARMVVASGRIRKYVIEHNFFKDFKVNRA